MSDLHDWIDSRLNQADELEERDWPTDEIIAKVKQECYTAFAEIDPIKMDVFEYQAAVEQAIKGVGDE